MRRSGAVGLLLLSALLTVGCKKKAPPPYAAYSAFAARPAMAMVAGSRPPERHIAVRHTLEIVVPESELQKDWESTIAFCGTIHCEVTGSNLSSGTAGAPPSAAIFLRIAPEDLPRLFGELGKAGRIVRHATETQDKTDAVIDADAKIKNLTAYRDSLRGLLSRSAASLKDLVAIQEQLSNVQSELDSEQMKRKVLANETEKVAVEITFVTAAAVAERGFFDRLGAALSESGDTFTESIESLIQFVVAVIPWLVVLVPAVWGIVKLFRKLRRKRAAAAAPPVTGRA